MGKILNKIWGRATEASSMAGLAAILMGVNQIFKSPEAGQAAEAAAQAAELVAVNPILAWSSLATGLVAIFKPEKGN